MGTVIIIIIVLNVIIKKSRIQQCLEHFFATITIITFYMCI